MPARHTVAQGECVESLAEKYGHFTTTIWKHPDNAELRQLRGDGTVLMTGDVVVIPDKRPDEQPCPTGQVHVFRRKGVPSMYKVQLFEDQEPRAGVRYVFECDGTWSQGTTDDHGWVMEWIPPHATEAKLTIDGRSYPIKLGHLDPATEPSGQRARLKNLGYLASDDPADDEDGAALKAAVSAFQSARELEPTGRVDDQTREQLVRAHGS